LIDKLLCSCCATNIPFLSRSALSGYQEGDAADPSYFFMDAIHHKVMAPVGLWHLSDHGFVLFV
jgi:hypothetical protein